MDQQTVRPPPAPPLSADLFSRITGKLTRNITNMKGTQNVCSVRESCEAPVQQLSPKDVAEEIMRQFEYCLPHSHGESELHNVAFCGDALRLRLLLENIDSHPCKLSTINQRNRLGCTPVRLAATGGHETCLNLLIKAGADINIVDVKGQTPLFVAVKNRRLGCARLLLESGACPDGDSKNSSTPLYVAFMNGDIQYVLLLLQYGAHPDKLRHLSPGSTLLFHGGFAPKISTLVAAMEHLHEGDVYKAVRALLERGCRTYSVHYHSCVYMDRMKLVDLLHAYGIRSDWRDENGRLATELNVKNDAKDRLLVLRESPRSLLSACRVTIISKLPRPRKGLDCVDSLPLPSPLITYLKFPDV
ncbi:ankyrin repeat and socs box protein 1-like [Plakobranchus ocellatus]|uniref:Ankyrin repeat and socs box protein 1-like n=1 Tax=Plakobranchus ocellatus TaxID=259542 RepID=A0AAV4AVV0_9GAST|nr:ankyrin repeat and socs box protein 1-like [Plakobranchus ocellatus]